MPAASTARTAGGSAWSSKIIGAGSIWMISRLKTLQCYGRLIDAPAEVGDLSQTLRRGCLLVSLTPLSSAEN
jgi:hypothetical protein